MLRMLAKEMVSSTGSWGSGMLVLNAQNCRSILGDRCAKSESSCLYSHVCPYGSECPYARRGVCRFAQSQH